MALTLRPDTDQETDIERLKAIFDVGTASKALLLAAHAYLDQREVLHDLARSHNQVESRLNRIIELQLDQVSIVDQLNEIRDQGPSKYDCNVPAALDDLSRMVLRDNVSQHGIHYLL